MRGFILNMRNCSPLIEYKNVNVVRDGRHLLEDINLKIGCGEHVAILGPNGAGKSSLIKTISREYYPTAGIQDSFVRILGENLWDIFELRNHLGIVYGDMPKSYLRDVTCFDFVLSGFFGSLGTWPDQQVTAKMKTKVRNILGLLEVKQLAERSLDQISTGESRKIMIGRCLVHDPPTLLLDEPTASLDPKATRDVRSTLSKLANKGKSLIMITQNLSDILPEIDRVIMIKGGRIFKDGPKGKLVTAQNLSALFGLRLRLMKRDGYYYCF
jgi:iron complex transport system ATP-binding protein